MRGRLTKKEKLLEIMWNLTVIFSSVILYFVVITDAEPARYDGFKLLRVKATHKTDMEFVRKIYDSGDEKLDFWREPRTPDQMIDIMVAPSHEVYARSLLEHDGITVHKVMEDVQSAIDEQIEVNEEMDDEDQLFFGNYQNLSMIDDWMIQLSEVYPEIVSTFQIATSYEKRPINCLKVGAPSPTGDVKPAIFLLGGMHSREWISPATVMYMAKELIEGYAVEDDDMKALLDGLDWYILPVLNVDGYVFTFESFRLWRKTRSKPKGNRCAGADPNRNWDFHWGVSGVSTLTCDDTYAGPFAFSETEVKQLAVYLTGLVERQPVFAFMDFHAYSQYWMTPYGYDTVLPDNYEDQLSLALDATSAIEQINGTKYDVGSIADVIYKAAGNSADYTHGVLGVPFCYAIELPDTGDHGFLLPPRYIIPVGQETLEAIKVIGQAGLGYLGNETAKMAPSLTTA
ncbi:carboxypeptidase B-like [Asterias rubens]|uniref:carboxypeptidase B-like n=1 Tax=Asterias rubens TaxID=7604 RepID=UPI001455BAF2|nr:carboxypeptidase B-like [Asterias rubens]